MFTFYLLLIPRYLIALSKKNITPINEKIRAEEVMLIGANGEKMGSAI